MSILPWCWNLIGWWLHRLKLDSILWSDQCNTNHVDYYLPVFWVFLFWTSRGLLRNDWRSTADGTGWPFASVVTRFVRVLLVVAELSKFDGDIGTNWRDCDPLLWLLFNWRLFCTRSSSSETSALISFRSFSAPLGDTDSLLFMSFAACNLGNDTPVCCRRWASCSLCSSLRLPCFSDVPKTPTLPSIPWRRRMMPGVFTCVFASASSVPSFSLEDWLLRRVFSPCKAK